MNSSFVETDEVQRRWLSILASDLNTATYADPTAGLSHPDAQPQVVGYPRYVAYPSFESASAYSYGGYGDHGMYQNQSQPAMAGSEHNTFEAVPIEHRYEYNINQFSVRPLADTASRLKMDLPAPYTPSFMPDQTYSAPPTHAVHPTGIVRESTVPQSTDAKVPFIDVQATLPSSMIDPVISTRAMEETRADPPMIDDGGVMPRQQSPRFDGDQYAASWIRGSGVERAGWCGFCPTWHRLKDSAYWYHMHYSHGISCVTGKQFKEPVQWRQRNGVTAYEALCGGCYEWVYIGRPERWRTPYYRHAYKCQLKNTPSLNMSRSRSKSSSPRKPKSTMKYGSF